MAWAWKTARAKHGDKVGYTPIYGGVGLWDDIRFGARTQWGWPDDECMDVMPGLGKQGG